jgi:AcrR family transcriptional regulator
MDNDIIILTETRPKSRADALKNRILLLETAQRLFNEMGVEAVSMSAVAEAAGVGKGTLYRHFTNKTELCQALLDQDQRALQERTFARMRQNHNPVGNLRWFVGEVLHFVDDHLPLLFVGALSQRASSTLEHPAHHWWRLTILGLLEQIDPSGDIGYKADVLYVMLDVHTLEYQRNGLGYSLERIENGLLATLDQLIA